MREQYSRAIAIHVEQCRIWDARWAALWRMFRGLPLAVLATITRVMTYPLTLLSGNVKWSQT